MAHIYPVLNESQLQGLPSQAEAVVYRHLRDQLDDGFVVIHGKSFVAERKDGSHGDGEADFAIFSANHSLLIIEVKGGGVSYSPESGWSSVDRMGRSHEIKDPVAQAKGQKYAFLNQLQSHRSWTRLRRRITLGHAVLLPDIDNVTNLELPECPSEIVGGRGTLDNIQSWLISVFEFWEGDNSNPLGDDGLRIVEQIFCHPIDVRPLLRDILIADNDIRIRLTLEQASVLRTLGRHKRAGIVGAAGTGKTILAMEKARMLADLGHDVLLVCFNKALSATVSRQFDPSGKVLACTFHQFCQHCCRKAIEGGFADPMKLVEAEVPGADYFDIMLPLAAFYAIEDMGETLQFDAIIVDEGQDFGEEFWLPLEMALRSSEHSWLYVFYDENQRLYNRASSFPIPESSTYPLTKNCRNSLPVHELAYRYYEGEPADDSGIAGVNPIAITSSTPVQQAKQIARQVTKLIHDEGVAPSAIAILVAGRHKEECYDLLRNEPLPRPASWSREEHFVDDGVLMDTVKRFKGLERDVIFLWLDQDAVVSDALMYVGVSRAKSVLYLAGDSEVLDKLQLPQGSS